MFTKEELEILQATISHDIATLQNLPKKGGKFNQIISAGIMKREKIEQKVKHELEKRD